METTTDQARPPVTHAPKGKIARLPHSLRQAVNQRLRDGEPGSVLLPWLNAQPEVRRILDLHFGGADINDQNLTNWRQGEFAKWCDERDEIEQTKAMAELASKLAEAAGEDLSAGARAIAAGRIMAKLQHLGEDADMESLDALVLAAARLAQAETQKSAVKLHHRRADQKDKELRLAEAKFQRETCKLFLQWHDDQRAREIASSPEKKDVKMEQLRLLLFGAPPASSP